MSSPNNTPRVVLYDRGAGPSAGDLVRPSRGQGWLHVVEVVDASPDIVPAGALAPEVREQMLAALDACLTHGAGLWVPDLALLPILVLRAVHGVLARRALDVLLTPSANRWAPHDDPLEGGVAAATATALDYETAVTARRWIGDTLMDSAQAAPDAAQPETNALIATWQWLFQQLQEHEGFTLHHLPPPEAPFQQREPAYAALALYMRSVSADQQTIADVLNTSGARTVTGRRYTQPLVSVLERKYREGEAHP